MGKLKQETRPKKIGWFLGRVSSTIQGTVQHGSLEQQGNMAIEWQKRITADTGIDYLINRFIEEERSGRKSKFHLRTGFQELIRAVETNAVDFIVFENIARMGRWGVKNLNLLEIAHETGVEVYFLDKGVNHGRYSHRDKGDRIKTGIENLMVEEESNDNKERVERKQRSAMMNNGKDSSTCPTLGLDAHPTKVCFYQINSVEAGVVIDIATQFIKLGDLSATAAYCAKRGYQTKRRQTLGRVGKDGIRISPRQLGGIDFDADAVRLLLTNPKLRGFNYFRDDWDQFPDRQNKQGLVRWEYAHGSVIPPDLGLQIDTILDSNKKHRPKVGKDGRCYLLSGILKAPDGTPFIGVPGKRCTYHYYILTRGLHKGQIPSIPKAEIDKIVCKRIREYISESATIAQVIRTAHKSRLTGLPLVEEEIRKSKHKVDRLENILSGFSETLRKAVLESPASVSAICEALVTEREKVLAELVIEKGELDKWQVRKKEIADTFENVTVVDFMKKSLKHFDQKTDLEKRQLIKAIIPEIIVHPENKLELRIVADPNGSVSCHSGEQKVLAGTRWRERRDSNPRPPA